MLQMYIKYQPVGDDQRDTANSDSFFDQIFFDGERVYCQMLTSSTINHDLYGIRKALTMLVASAVLCLVSDVTEDTPLPGVCLECREDSPVVSRPHPELLSLFR